MEENGRLTDLLRLLLSSPQFSNFLNEMNDSDPPRPSSSSSVSQPAAQPEQHHRHHHQSQRRTSKVEPFQRAPSHQEVQPLVEETEDVKPNMASLQDVQPPMVVVPGRPTTTTTDGSDLNSGWNSGIVPCYDM